ncbi:universal stress protein [Cerasicoccus arenae]|uniref:Universal stress protein n=1 Tax=Cerasicoccus arenae TaxID=424488 RepID=A0A8J3DET1_9BACT|nr:universal stress protein [Cerasicoccus arenae]MBK1857936.1 universal stress protein [Cerasicoccus arenae]GHB97956.1 universal stress protein [Cerasicoccus arenae]
MKVILCAVDFSDEGKGVVEAAAAEARLRDAQLWLVHVAAPDPTFVGYEAGPDNERIFRAGTLRAEHQTLQERAEELKLQGVDATAILVQGPTCEMLIKEACDLEADLIVIGSHRHGLWHRALWGSTEDSVIEQAPCPVLVVPVAI